MAKRSNVPKFGTWDGADVGYTAYFENARQGKGRGAGGRIVNPNDPEQLLELQEQDNKGEPQPRRQAPAIPKNPNRNIGLPESSPADDAVYYASTPQRLQQETQRPNKDADRPQQRDGPNNYPPKGTQYRDRSSGNRPAVRREDGNDGGPSENPYQIRGQSRNNQVRERRDYPTGMSPHHPMSPSRNHQQADGQHQRGASVPVFGNWNPGASNFTMIFEQVKEERQQNKMPTPLITPGAHTPQRQSVPVDKPAKSRMACCFM